ncbi:unnamed protein product [Chrysoparadoxa australica]
MGYWCIGCLWPLLVMGGQGGLKQGALAFTSPQPVACSSSLGRLPGSRAYRGHVELREEENTLTSVDEKQLSNIEHEPLPQTEQPDTEGWLSQVTPLFDDIKAWVHSSNVKAVEFAGLGGMIPSSGKEAPWKASSLNMASIHSKRDNTALGHTVLNSQQTRSGSTTTGPTTGSTTGPTSSFDDVKPSNTWVERQKIRAQMHGMLDSVVRSMSYLPRRRKRIKENDQLTGLDVMTETKVDATRPIGTAATARAKSARSKASSSGRTSLPPPSQPTPLAAAQLLSSTEAERTRIPQAGVGAATATATATATTSAEAAASDSAAASRDGTAVLNGEEKEDVWSVDWHGSSSSSSDEPKDAQGTDPQGSVGTSEDPVQKEDHRNRFTVQVISPPKYMEVTVNSVLGSGGDVPVAEVEAEAEKPSPVQTQWRQRRQSRSKAQARALMEPHRRHSLPYVPRDLLSLDSRVTDITAMSASATRTRAEAQQLLKQVGLGPLVMGMHKSHDLDQKIKIAEALCHLIKIYPPAAGELLKNEGVPLDLAHMVQAGEVTKGIRSLRSMKAVVSRVATLDLLDRKHQHLRKASTNLVCQLLLTDDSAVKVLQRCPELVSALRRLVNVGAVGDAKRWEGVELSGVEKTAYRCLAMLGAHTWVKRGPGHKGVRVLCLDGGGTRGVLSIAMLKELKKATGQEPRDMFDVIMGTSTGGIIAALIGLEGNSVDTCAQMYDDLVQIIFQKKAGAGVKLAMKQGFYDEEKWMEILASILGDQTMIDFADHPTRPKVVFPSTIISVNPSKLWMWRTYNYPPGLESRYLGSFRNRVRDCIRATTAAPTFFSPVLLNDMVYSDGALMANNPGALAFHEAGRLFPGIPVECVVSVGTGYIGEVACEGNDKVGWDGILNHLVASATETEATHDVLTDLVAPHKYFRFNPLMENMPIDEVRVEKLEGLKALGARYFEEPEIRERLRRLALQLTG